jgi:hypothetical protein
MSPNLMALEPLRNDINVVSGMANPTGFEAMGGGQHAQGLSTFANATVCTAKGAGGPTIEQVAAAQFGGSTKYRSIVMNNEPPTTDTDSFTTAHCNNISWSAKETFVPPLRDPVQIFKQLFSTPIAPPSTGSGGTTSPPTGVDMASARKKSILDYVAAQTTTLEGKLGGDDKARIDQHLSSIRELERQLITPAPTVPPPSAGSGCAQPATPADGLPADKRAYANLTLLATAINCGLTRYASFAMANAFLDSAIPGFPKATVYHSFVHREITATDDDVAAVVTYFVDKLVFFLNLLKGAGDDGTSTVLDNSIVYFTSEMAMGQHQRDPMPVIVAGKAGGQLKTGRHLSYQDVPISRLLLTLTKLAGLNLTSFGEGGTSVLSDF